MTKKTPKLKLSDCPECDGQGHMPCSCCPTPEWFTCATCTGRGQVTQCRAKSRPRPGCPCDACRDTAAAQLLARRRPTKRGIAAPAPEQVEDCADQPVLVDAGSTAAPDKLT